MNRWREKVPACIIRHRSWRALSRAITRPKIGPTDHPIDEQGTLTQTIDGKPITARYVVGRRMVGGEDQALAPAQYDAVTTGSIGSVPEAVAAGTLPRGSVGAYRVGRGADGPERSIGILNSLSPQSASMVASHEMGHMIDDLSGIIPTSGLSSELRPLYNSLNNGNRNHSLTDARQNSPMVTPKVLDLSR